MGIVLNSFKPENSGLYSSQKLSLPICQVFILILMAVNLLLNQIFLVKLEDSISVDILLIHKDAHMDGQKSSVRCALPFACDFSLRTTDVLLCFIMLDLIYTFDCIYFIQYLIYLLHLHLMIFIYHSQLHCECMFNYLIIFNYIHKLWWN